MGKSELLNVLNHIEKTYNQVESENVSLLEKINTCKERIIDYVPPVVLVGEFNAGKTSLLNAIMGKGEVLKEDITPETAIATELQYGISEYIMAVRPTGELVEFSLNEAKSISVKDYKKLIYYINSPSLKAFDQFRFVDMPGFGSMNENHNRAISQYIREAAAYVFVIDMSLGTMTQSTAALLEEIQSYTPYILFVLTRKDKLNEEDQSAVVGEIKSSIQRYTGADLPLLSISCRDTNAGSELVDFFKSLNVDQMIWFTFSDDIYSIIETLKIEIILRLKNNDLDVDDINREIRRMESVQEELFEKIKHEKGELSYKLHNDIPRRITEDIKSALLADINGLTYSILEGGNSFDLYVNAILRPIFVNNLDSYVEESFSGFVASLEGEFTDLLGLSQEIGSEVQKHHQKLEIFFKTGTKLAELMNFNKLYKILSTGLALTTSVLGPLVEMLLIFLPEIINMFSSLFGQSKEEIIKEKLTNTVIPQICSSMERKVRESLKQVEAKMMKEIDIELNDTINECISTLATLKDKKIQKEDGYYKQQEMLAKSLQILNSFEKKLEYLDEGVKVYGK